MELKTKKHFNLKLYLNTRQELVYAGILIGVSVLLTFLIILPQFNKLNQSRSVLKKEQKKLTLLRKKAADLNNLRAGVGLNQLKILDQLLPNEKPLLELMTQLSNIAKLTGVEMSNLQLTPGIIAENDQSQVNARVGRKSYGTLKIEMSVSGSFLGVRQFMDLVEKIAPFTTINEFSFNYDENTNDDEIRKASAQLTTSTYFYTRPKMFTSKSELPKVSDKDLKILNQLAQFKQLDVIFKPLNGSLDKDLFKIEGWRKSGQSESSLQGDSSLNVLLELTPTPLPTTLKDTPDLDEVSPNSSF